MGQIVEGRRTKLEQKHGGLSRNKGWCKLLEQEHGGFVAKLELGTNLFEERRAKLEQKHDLYFQS